jgi:hypothetical protein
MHLASDYIYPYQVAAIGEVLLHPPHGAYPDMLQY